MSKANDEAASFDDAEISKNNGLGKRKRLPVVVRAMPGFAVPTIISDLGYPATLRFLDFFTANIRNPNTRAAYAVAVLLLRLARCARRLRAAGHPHASRVRLHRGADEIAQGADRQTAPRGDPHALRSADRRLGGREQPGSGGARTQARRQARQDASARSR